MKTQMLSMRRMTRALLLVGCASVVGPAAAAEFWLRAEPLNVTMPGGGSVPMWGYALDGTSCAAPPCAATVPGPALTVAPGDTTLTVHLKNNLPAPSSIVIPGQTAAMIPVWDDGSSGPRPSLTARVRSFTSEAAAGGGTADYTWNNLKAGTYLYHSGTHPQVQVQMGLYGAVQKDAAAGQAYPGVAYDNALTLLYSEIDPALHAAVANGTYGTAGGPTSTLNYQPKYFLINGKPFQPGDPALATVPAGGNTLLRFLNAGLKTHVPVLNGQYLKLVAEDGNAYTWPRQQYSVQLPALKTIDAIVVPQAAAGPAPTRYALFDRRLDLTTNGMQDGGMLAYIDVTSAGSSPAFTSVPVTAATQGMPYSYQLSAADPDGGALSYSLVTAPAGMTASAAGLISWTPSSTQVGSQAVTARVKDPTGLYADQSFSIAVVSVNHPPLAVNDAYTMIRGGSLNVAAPGVLGNDSDPDAGNVLSAVLVTPPYAGGLALNANGSFTYQPAVTFSGTRSFTYQAQDNSGNPASNTSNTATATLNVIANRAPVATNDTASAPVLRLANQATYAPVVISVLNNDADPDTVIDPANTIDPATVTITSQPNKGGTVSVNPDGTINYTPLLNYRGSEVFRYTVKDTYHNPTAPNPGAAINSPATSNAGYVRVNVQ